MSPYHSNKTTQGFLSTLGAFLLWGIIPVYWKQFEGIQATELLFQRILWSMLFLLILVKWRGSWGKLVDAFRDRKIIFLHSVCGLLIFCNWLAYVYAVTNKMILESSLAYFMVPLVNAAFGVIFLKESMSRLQLIAIGLAGVGVLNELIQLGRLPFVVLVMAGSFGIYGLLKKKTPLGAITGLVVENMVITPIAIIGLIVIYANGWSDMAEAPSSIQWLLGFSGVVTTIPLILFAFGAARVKLITVGLLQFTAPMVKFSLGIWIYHEPLSSARMMTFALIWAGLILYSIDSFRLMRRRSQAVG